MDKALAAAAQRVKHRVDRAAVIAVGGIDDGVGRAGFVLQQRGIVQRANNGFDAECA
ncbi:hypothetical protein D3C87_2153390 [compost metagenome]